MAEPASFAEASMQVASRFLETVVVIDDRADFTSRPQPPAAPGSAKAGKRPSGRSQLVTPPQSALLAAGSEHDLNAKVLVDAFAERGLVCAVLKPALGEDPKQRTVAASRRSDIVVIDWYLHAESGEASLGLLDGILQSDEDDNQGRIRLVAIYTGEGRLHEIQERVADRLDKHYIAHRLRRRGFFAVDKGPVRIVIYAKPGARIPSQERATRRRIVDVPALPDKLIGEFAGMTSGLVPHVALMSIAAVRRRTHRMLTALHAGLDPAYLWHRAMQGRPADAEDHLVELVVGEVRSILDDADAGGAANLQQIGLWLAAQGAAVDYGDRFSVDTAPSTADVASLLDGGTGGATLKVKFPSLQRDPPENIKGFAPTNEAANRAHAEFAVAMSQRTVYERRTPRLTLGTIMCTGSGGSRRYWLSMQPRCDSVRLESEQNFPLLPLEPVLSPRKKFGLVLRIGPTRYLKLRAASRPADLEMIAFSVAPRDDCVVAQARGTGYAFKTVTGRWYRWLGELKFEPAQRTVEEIASEFSRVGITESEWLRRWSPRG